ncbi:hypothetical protein HanXRQr2_Chr14g0623921 [Helianthus annuus]|uniref:Uncharacterized protein n=1 Tax=Helianthus annuus TaxID=4232 RepID=A0A9K3E5H5_HELAN|nr:hypothetical protein HanXRQr2_Chr14g0623921 [Helianthus annuus]KAJ0929341.1 hypothetical protein HanPSC8_Chr04g0136521 [Helianthus annuus]
MTGIPRSIAEHELRIPPNVKPVVQKKRSLAPERSLAACQEVEKLVSAGILREVKYQSWIANPISKILTRLVLKIVTHSQKLISRLIHSRDTRSNASSMHTKVIIRSS